MKTQNTNIFMKLFSNLAHPVLSHYCSAIIFLDSRLTLDLQSLIFKKMFLYWSFLVAQQVKALVLSLLWLGLLLLRRCDLWPRGLLHGAGLAKKRKRKCFFIKNSPTKLCPSKLTGCHPLLIVLKTPLITYFRIWSLLCIKPYQILRWNEEA